MWVICGRNVALGVFESYLAAAESLWAEHFVRKTPGGFHSSDTDYSEWERETEILTLVRLDQTAPFTVAMPLFQEQPAR